MNCDEVARLLGAYALDALPAQEREEIERHLATCNLHEETVSLLSAAATLPFTAASEAPPPTLRARVLEAIANDAVVVEPPAPIPAPQQRTVSIPLTARYSRRIAWAPYALAAAFAVISLGLLVWNVMLLSDGDTAAPRVVLLAGSTGSGAVVLDDGDAIVHVAGLPGLDPSQTYQVWLVEGGTPISAGLLTPDDAGRATLELARSVPASAVVAITIEPAGGSPQPTSDPILAAEL